VPRARTDDAPRPPGNPRLERTLDPDDPDQATVLKAPRVVGLQTIAVVAADGRVVSTHAGYLKVEPFFRMMASVIDGMKKRRYRTGSVLSESMKRSR